MQKMGLKSRKLQQYDSNQGQKVEWAAEASLPDEADFYPSQQSRMEATDGNQLRGVTILVTGAETVVGEQMLISLLRRKLSAQRYRQQHLTV